MRERERNWNEPNQTIVELTKLRRTEAKRDGSRSERSGHENLLKTNRIPDWFLFNSLQIYSPPFCVTHETLISIQTEPSRFNFGRFDTIQFNSISSHRLWPSLDRQQEYNSIWSDSIQLKGASWFYSSLSISNKRRARREEKREKT